MLNTKLPTIQSKQELSELLKTNEKVAVCCGRMGPMCIPVYDIFEIFQEKYPDIIFRNMDFDSPESSVIRNLPECSRFNGLPFTVYYRNGKVVHATSSIQTAQQVKDIIGKVLA